MDGTSLGSLYFDLGINDKTSKEIEGILSSLQKTVDEKLRVKINNVEFSDSSIKFMYEQIRKALADMQISVTKTNIIDTINKELRDSKINQIRVTPILEEESMRKLRADFAKLQLGVIKLEAPTIDNAIQGTNIALTPVVNEGKPIEIKQGGFVNVTANLDVEATRASLQAQLAKITGLKVDVQVNPITPAGTVPSAPARQRTHTADSNQLDLNFSEKVVDSAKKTEQAVRVDEESVKRLEKLQNEIHLSLNSINQNIAIKQGNLESYSTENVNRKKEELAELGEWLKRNEKDVEKYKRAYEDLERKLDTARGQKGIERVQKEMEPYKEFLDKYYLKQGSYNRAKDIVENASRNTPKLQAQIQELEEERKLMLSIKEAAAQMQSEISKGHTKEQEEVFKLLEELQQLADKRRNAKGAINYGNDQLIVDDEKIAQKQKEYAEANARIAEIKSKLESLKTAPAQSTPVAPQKETAKAEKEAAQIKKEAAEIKQEAAKKEEEAVKKEVDTAQKEKDVASSKKDVSNKKSDAEKANEAAIKQGIAAMKKIDSAMDSTRLSIARKGKKMNDELKEFKAERARIYAEIAKLEGGKEALSAYRQSRVVSGNLTTLKANLAYNQKQDAIQEKLDLKYLMDYLRSAATKERLSEEQIQRIAQLQYRPFMASERMQWALSNKSNDIAARGGRNVSYEKSIQLIEQFQQKLLSVKSIEEAFTLGKEWEQLSSNIQATTSNADKLNQAYLRNKESIEKLAVAAKNRYDLASASGKTSVSASITAAYEELNKFNQKLANPANWTSIEELGKEFNNIKLKIVEAETAYRKATAEQKKNYYTSEEATKKIEAALIRVANKQRELNNYTGTKGADWQKAQTALTQYIQKLEALKASGTTGKSAINAAIGIDYQKAVLEINKFLDAQKRVDAVTRASAAANNKANEAVHKHADAYMKLNTNLGKSKGLLSLNINLMQQLGSMIGMYFSIYTIQRFVSGIAQIYGEFEKTKIALGSILNDTARANELFNELKSLAVQSPYQFKDLTGFVKQLSAFSFPVDELYDTTKRLADISAGLGVDMGRVILAVGQVRSAAYLRGQELRQFTEAGIPLLDELAKKLTILKGRAIDTGQVFDMISKRQVPYELVKEIIDDLTNDGGKFYNMQEVLAESLAGKISNLTDAYNIMQNEIGEMGAGDAMGKMVDWLKALMQNWRLLGNIIVSVGAGYAGTLVRAKMYHQGSVAEIGKEIVARKNLEMQLLKERSMIVQLGSATTKYGQNEEVMMRLKLKSAIASGKITEMDLIRMRVQGTLSRETMKYGLIRMGVNQHEAEAIKRLSRFRLMMVAANAATVAQAATMTKMQLSLNFLIAKFSALGKAIKSSIVALASNPATWIFAAVGLVSSMWTSYESKKNERERAVSEARDAAREAFNDIRQSTGEIDNSIEFKLSDVKTMGTDQLSDDMKSKVLRVVERMKEVIQKHSPIAAKDLFDIESIDDIIGKLNKASEIIESMKQTSPLKGDIAADIVDYDENDSFKRLNKYRKSFTDAWKQYDMSKMEDALNLLSQKGYNTLAQQVRDMYTNGAKTVDIFTKLGSAYASMQESVRNHTYAGASNPAEGFRGVLNVVKYYDRMIERQGDIDKAIGKLVEDADRMAVGSGFPKGSRDYNYIAEEYWNQFQTKHTEMMSNPISLRYSRVAFEQQMFGYSEEQAKDLVDVYFKSISDEEKKNIDINSEEFKKAALDKLKGLIGSVTYDMNGFVLDNRIFDVMARMLPKPDVTGWRKEIIDAIDGIKSTSDVYIKIKESKSTADVIDDLQKIYKAGKEVVDKQKPLLIKLGLDVSDIEGYFDENGNIKWDKIDINGPYSQEYIREVLETTKSQGLTPQKEAEQGLNFLGASLTKSNSTSTADKQLQAWKKQFDALKKIYNDYKSWQKDLGRQRATELLQQSGMTSEDIGDIATFDPEKMQQYFAKMKERILKNKMSSEERKSFSNSLNEYEIQLKVEVERNSLQDALSTIRMELEKSSKEWGIYKTWFNATGDKALAQQVAFGGFVGNDNYADALREKLKSEYDKIQNPEIAYDQLLTTNEKTLKEKFGEYTTLLEIIKKIQDEDNKLKEENANTLLEIIKNNKNFEQQLAEIERNRDKDLGLIQNNANLTPGAKKQYEEGTNKKYDEQKSKVLFEQFKATENWAEIFDDLDRVSTSTLDSMYNKIKAFATTQGLTVQETKELVSAMSKLRTEAADRNPFKGFANGLRDIRESKKNLKSLDTILRQMKAVGTDKWTLAFSIGKLKAGKTYTKKEIEQEQQNQQNGNASGNAELDEATTKLIGKFQALAEVSDQLASLFDSMGMGSGFGDVMSAAGSAFSAAGSTASSATAIFGAGAGVYGAIAGAAISVAGTLFGLHDKALDKAINNSKQRVEELQSAYDELEKSIDRAFGNGSSSFERAIKSYTQLMNQTSAMGVTLSDSSKSMYTALTGGIKSYKTSLWKDLWKKKGWEISINKEALAAINAIGTGTIKNKTGEVYRAEYASLVAQRAEIESQMRNEQAKKKSDSSAISDYADQIADLNDQITYFVQDLAKELYGIDFEDWAGQFSDSLVEAFRNGENAAEAFKDTANDILASVANDMVKLNIIEPMFEELEETLFGKIDANGNRSGGVATMENLFDAPEKVAAAISEWFNSKGELMVEEVDAFLKLFNDATGGSLTATSSKSGLSASISGITEDTADLLASYVNAIRADLSAMRTMATEFYLKTMPDVTTTLGAQLASLKMIETNTLRTANGVEDISDISKDTNDLLHKLTKTGSGVKLNV
jgi:hypothetical protein